MGERGGRGQVWGLGGRSGILGANLGGLGCKSEESWVQVQGSWVQGRGVLGAGLQGAGGGVGEGVGGGQLWGLGAPTRSGVLLQCESGVLGANLGVLGCFWGANPGSQVPPGPSGAPGSGCWGGRVLGAGGWGGTRPELAASLVGGSVPTAPWRGATLPSTLPTPAPALAPLPAHRLGCHVPSCGRGPGCPHSWLCVPGGGRRSRGGGAKCLKRGQGVPEGEMGVSRGHRSSSKGPKFVQRGQGVPKGVWMSPNGPGGPQGGARCAQMGSGGPQG